jgi:hypothetical protein
MRGGRGTGGERCHRWKRLNEDEDGGLLADNGSGSPVGFTADQRLPLAACNRGEEEEEREAAAAGRDLSDTDNPS